MPDLAPVFHLLAAVLPFESLETRFMQQALFALLLLAPMTASLGVQVVSLRMAFFSDAVSHSAFAGAALGLIFGVSPHLSMPLLGVAMGLGVMFVQRHSLLSSDTVIGVFFSAVMAFGLAAVSREYAGAQDLQHFLYGDILTIGHDELWWLIALFVAVLLFQFWGYNRMLTVSLNPDVAGAHRVPVAFCRYLFAALLSLVVLFSVRAAGVLLPTALLIVPAATARNLARTAGGMFWWALLAGAGSAIGGLILSAQDWMGTATGATVVLVACLCFVVSLPITLLRGGRRD